MKHCKNKKDTTYDIMGFEVEFKYRGDIEDLAVPLVYEYYNSMVECNQLIFFHKKTLSGIKNALYHLHNSIVYLSDISDTNVSTCSWFNSYGYAFNGVHIHLNGLYDVSLLERNLLRVVDLIGITPRVATSHHCRNLNSNFQFKLKNKHRPVFVTPIGTTEIRLFDIEYFLKKEYVEWIALAIFHSTKGNELELVGEYQWFHTPNYIEDLGEILQQMEANIAPWYKKVGYMNYLNTFNVNYIQYAIGCEDDEDEDVLSEEFDVSGYTNNPINHQPIKLDNTYWDFTKFPANIVTKNNKVTIKDSGIIKLSNSKCRLTIINLQNKIYKKKK